MVCMHVSGSAAEYPPWQEPHWEEPTHAAYPCSPAPAVVSPFCWGNGFGGLSALIKLYKGQQFSPNDYVSLLLSVARCLSPRTENSGLWGVQPLAPPWVWCRCVRPGTSMASHSWIVSVFHSHCHPSLWDLGFYDTYGLQPRNSVEWAQLLSNVGPQNLCKWKSNYLFILRGL